MGDNVVLIQRGFPYPALFNNLGSCHELRHSHWVYRSRIYYACYNWAFRCENSGIILLFENHIFDRPAVFIYPTAKQVKVKSSDR